MIELTNGAETPNHGVAMTATATSGQLAIWTSRPVPSPYDERLNSHHLVVGPIETIPDDVFAVIAAARPEFDDEFMVAHPGLRVIARTGTGYDNVDIKAATQRGIVVCTNPGGGAILATAEHALALLLAASKKLEFTRHLIRSGETDSFSKYTSKQLTGCRVGIVGYGRIGSAFGQLVSGLGLEVAAFDPYVDETIGATKVDDLERLLGIVDVVSLHVPLTEETDGLVDADFLAAMRPGSILVNTSKGALIDEQALADALDTQHIFAAGLDSSRIEPMPSGTPLYDRTDVILSPQVGASTHEAKASLWSTVVDQILAVAEGRTPVGALNPEVLGD